MYIGGGATDLFTSGERTVPLHFAGTMTLTKSTETILSLMRVDGCTHVIIIAGLPLCTTKRYESKWREAVAR